MAASAAAVAAAARRRRGAARSAVRQRGGGGFGGFGGALVQPGTYMVRLTVGSQTLTSSVNVLEDIWMRPQ